MWSRFKKETEVWMTDTKKDTVAWSDTANTQVFIEYCPGSLGEHGWCFKNLVVWLGQEQLERSVRTEDSICCCQMSTTAIQSGEPQVSGPNPDLLYWFSMAALQITTNLVMWSSTHIYYLPVSVGPQSWQLSWLLCQGVLPGCRQGVGQGWVYLRGSTGKWLLPVFFCSIFV